MTTMEIKIEPLVHDVTIDVDTLKRYSEIEVLVVVDKRVRIEIRSSRGSDIVCSENFRAANRRALQPLRSAMAGAELETAVCKFTADCLTSLFDRTSEITHVFAPVFHEVRFVCNDSEDHQTADELVQRFVDHCVANGRVMCAEFRDIVLSRATIASLQRALSNHSCVLEVLNVNTVCDAEFGDVLLNALSCAITANRHIHLKHLVASHVGATERSIVPFLALVRERRTKLLSLNLTDAVLTQVCLQALAKYVASDACGLLSLRIGDVMRDDKIALDLRPFCQAMCVNKTIQVLDLFSRHSGDAGMVAICDMLLHNKTLYDITVDCPCFIGNQAPSNPLCEVLLKNNTLSVLDVTECFEAHHTRLIVSALETGNFTLRDFNVAARASTCRDVDCEDEDSREENTIEDDADNDNRKKIENCLQRNELIALRKQLITVSAVVLMRSPNSVSNKVILDIFNMMSEFSPQPKAFNRSRKMNIIRGVRAWLRERVQSKKRNAVSSKKRKTATDAEIGKHAHTV